MDSGGASMGKKKGKREIDLEAALKKMKLKDSEIDDVFAREEEVFELSKSARWLAVARVNTSKPFNFCSNVKAGWTGKPTPWSAQTRARTWR